MIWLERRKNVLLYALQFNHTYLTDTESVHSSTVQVNGKYRVVIDCMKMIWREREREKNLLTL